MYNSIVAGKYMLAIAQANGIVLNATQLQKILFIAYGSILSTKGINILDEAPKAWPYGPVFPKVQKKVDAYIKYNLNDPDFSEISKDVELTKLFTSLVNKYSKLSASQLSNWSHAEGSPWEKTTKQAGFKWNIPIPDGLIKPYFSTFDV